MASGRSVNNQYDYEWRVVLVGDSGVGKTSLLSCFIYNDFNERITSNIGVEFATRNVNIKGKMVRAQIWDTSGQERFTALTSGYYRGAVGALVVYDLTKPQTFHNLDKWLDKLSEHAESSVRIMLVGNKTDLGHLRAITMEEGRALAEKKHFSCIETSALDSTNVGEAFNNLLVDIYKMQVEEQGKAPISQTQHAADLKGPNLLHTADAPSQAGCGC